MVRKLKHHESRLLRKVDFINYKSDNNHRDAEVIRRYAIQKPSDYTKVGTKVLLCSITSLIFVSSTTEYVAHCVNWRTSSPI